MKKIFYFVFSIELVLSVVGCSKSQSTEVEHVVHNESEVDEKNIVTNPISDNKLAQITIPTTDDEVNSEKKFTETVSRDTMQLQKKIRDLQFPYFFVSYSELQNSKILKYANNPYDNSKESSPVIIPINVLNLDEVTCQFEFKVIGLTGNEYTYKAYLDKPFIDTNISAKDKYAIMNLELILNNNDDDVITSDNYDIDLFTYDDKQDDLLKLFEENENLFYSDDKQRCIAIECKKIPLMKKDRDEYLVVFAKDLEDDKKKSLSHLVCYYFDGGELKRQIIYDNPNKPWTFMYDYNNREGVLSFCSGMINDFNNNKIPEIYLHVSIESGMALGDEIYVLEWDGQNFAKSYLHAGNHNFETYEMKFSYTENKIIIHSQEVISVEVEGPGVPNNPSRPIIYEYKYSWNQLEGIYILTDMKFINLPEYIY